MLAKFPANVETPAISFFVRYFNTLLTMLAQPDSSFSLEILKVVPFEHLIVQCASNEKAGDVWHHVCHPNDFSSRFVLSDLIPLLHTWFFFHNMSPSAGKMSPQAV